MIIRLIILFFLVLLPVVSFSTPQSANAQTACPTPPAGNVAVGDALVTAPSFSSTTYTSGVCITGDNSLVFLDQGKIQTDSYDNLRTLFYDQSKATKVAPGPINIASFTGLKVYSGPLNTNVSLAAVNIPNPNPDAVAVVFIDGDLAFTGNLVYGTADIASGIVFIVKGNVNINSNVTQIDAVIISSGTICTALDAAGGETSCGISYIPSSQLVINGILVILNATTPIKFRRTLTNNNNAAELVVASPKYLVILSGLLTPDLMITREL